MKFEPMTKEMEDQLDKQHFIMKTKLMAPHHSYDDSKDESESSLDTTSLTEIIDKFIETSTNLTADGLGKLGEQTEYIDRWFREIGTADMVNGKIYEGFHHRLIQMIRDFLLNPTLGALARLSQQLLWWTEDFTRNHPRVAFAMMTFIMTTLVNYATALVSGTAVPPGMESSVYNGGKSPKSNTCRGVRKSKCDLEPFCYWKTNQGCLSRLKSPNTSAAISRKSPRTKQLSPRTKMPPRSKKLLH